MITERARIRFFRKYKIDEITGCWNWTDKPTQEGYGTLCIKRGLNMGAHAVSYTIHKGEIKFPLVVRHKCDNKLCVNPDHLILGTRADNVADKCERDRNAKGIFNGNAWLTFEEITKIRKMYHEERIPITRLSRMFKSGTSTIYRIVTNQTRLTE